MNTTSGNVREFSGLIVDNGKQTNKFALVNIINRMILIAEQMNIIDDSIDSVERISIGKKTIGSFSSRPNKIVNHKSEIKELGTEGHGR